MKRIGSKTVFMSIAMSEIFHNHLTTTYSKTIFSNTRDKKGLQQTIKLATAINSVTVSWMSCVSTL
jgi:hypothetical protein